jgi:alpha-galactosidase
LAGVTISLIYELYADLPLVRKRLQVYNGTGAAVALTNLDVEKLRFQVVHKFDNEVYASYGTNLHRIPYKGDYNDAAVMLYNAAEKQGVVLGNEAPSVLKNTEIYTRIHGCVQMGMRHIEDEFPFKKWLNAGETFTSPATFIYAFHSRRWQDGFEDEYKTFLRRYAGVSLFQRRQPPLMMYNTWRPFLDSINQDIVQRCSDSLKNTFTDLFIIDAGWYNFSGDFIPDTVKFPAGMRSICDYLRRNGQKAGLWFSIASVNAKSRIVQLHPEWLVKGKDGKPVNLHFMNNGPDNAAWSGNMQTVSLGSPYYDHFKKTVRQYIRELGLAYVKFDLAIAASAYVHDPERTGDYDANEAKAYRDRASSYWTIYERMMKLMDELHEEFPDLLIDCTYETWGRYNSADYALAQHADYTWLTNFEQPPPDGPITIRQMTYDRSRVVPAASLLIGNQSVNFENYKYVFFSLASSSLILVGDPRTIKPEQRAFYKDWTSYLKEVERKYQYSQYFQLYDVFERPGYNNWDGCFRINTEKSGGLLFFFRNGSADEKRTFRIPCVDTAGTYRIYSHQQKRTLGIYNGKKLAEQGLTVNIPSTFTALVLTLEKVEGKKIVQPKRK